MKPKDLKFINEFHLHAIKMGEGSMWNKNKELVICVGSATKRMPCGCPEGEYIRVRNEKGKQVFEIINDFDPNDYQYILATFLQSSEWDSYWESFYQKYSFLKPILINNL